MKGESVLKFTLILLILLSSVAQARELYPGQYAQVDDATREWFRDQRNPTTKIPCCSEADGTYVEEDIRDGHYWVRFDKTGGEWREVPDDIVIHNPNRNGAPVVWYYYTTPLGSTERSINFRCYSPGSGL